MLRTALSTLGALALTATLSAVPSALSVPVAQAAPSGGMDVWSYNITGAGTNENNATDIDNGGRPRAVKPVTNALAAGHRPDVIALQEVCESQYTSVKPKLEAYGYTVHWRPTKSQRRCAAYRDYAPSAPTRHGDLVAVPSQYGPSAHSYDLDPRTAGGEGMACLLFSKQGRLVVGCSTHLAGTTEQRAYQTYRMRVDEIEPWANQGYGIVIAGDFNTQPGQEPMKNLDHRNGIMYEADRVQKRWTHQNRRAPYAKRKIDHVYFSGNYFPRTSFVAALDAKPEYSYHRFYAASSAMR